MNTPAHVIINLALLGKRAKWAYSGVIMIGGILPDIPLLIAYGIQASIIGSSLSRLEAPLLWISEVLHAFPILLLAMLLAWCLHRPSFLWLCLSMFLHALFDFPIHNEFAHRHFYPLSDFQFLSPFSYWDPQYFGHYFAITEMLIVLIASLFCVRHITTTNFRIIIYVTASFYFISMLYFIMTFGVFHPHTP